MTKYSIRSSASKHFSFHQLIQCGPTATLNNISYLPQQPETWEALSELATKILDPIVDQFGPLTLTYGFSPSQLTRKISKNKPAHIAPKLDQHASHELNSKLEPICPRLGAACDFFVNNQAISMAQVALWIASNLHFDRMYYYGNTRPLHISYGPDMNYFVQCMKTDSETRRRTPLSRGYGTKGVALLSALNY